MANGISRETYDGMDIPSKLGVLFDYAQEQHSKTCATSDQLEELKQKFERRKKIDTTISGASGIIGGAAVVFIKWIMGK